MFEFKLPDLGEGIHEGELLKWYVKAGEEIAEDEPLMDVETDKAAVTIPSPSGGKIITLSGEVGDTLYVGDVVVVIDDGSGESVAPTPTEKKEEKPPEPKKAAPVETKAATKKQVPAAVRRESREPDDGPVPAAPATRRLARKLGVEINRIQGSGPGGRVLPDDVKAFAEGGQAAVPSTAETAEEPAEKRRPVKFTGEGPAIPFFELEELPDYEKQGPVEREPMRSIRRKVARKMVTSMVLAPHVAHLDEADVTELENFRKVERKRREGTHGGKLTLLPLVIKAVTSLFRKYPVFNASIDPLREEIVYKKFYHIGFAADTDRGLLVPVVKDADKKSIIDISAEIEELAVKARDGNLEVNDMRGSTFTVTNVGPIGGTGLIPAINYPEVAILGMGRASERPVVRDGQIVVRKILPLTLTFDHRITDGAEAARFVTDLVRLLADPSQLLLEL